MSSLRLPQALQNMSVPSRQGEGCLPLAKGTPELELSHRLGFHSDTGACARQVMQLSPRSVRQCVRSRVPVQLPCTLPRGRSHAPCWVRGSSGKISWNAHMEARWWMGAWGHLCPSFILQVSPQSWPGQWRLWGVGACVQGQPYSPQPPLL